MDNRSLDVLKAGEIETSKIRVTNNKREHDAKRTRTFVGFKM